MNPESPLDDAAEAFRRFVEIIKSLRTPETGCPWDLEQDHASLRPYLIEETYEVIDAIDQKDTAHLREELGDLLPTSSAQIVADCAAFSIADVSATSLPRWSAPPTPSARPRSAVPAKATGRRSRRRKQRGDGGSLLILTLQPALCAGRG